MDLRTLLRVHCWVCGNAVDEFASYGIPPRIGRCPHCGAKPRNRALVWLLENHVVPRLDPGAEVLEVGASALAALHHRRIIAAGEARYTVIDVRRLRFHATIPAPHRYLEMDISRAEFGDASFDLVLCNNTLPYVRNYRAALTHIRRCLKPQGLAMINTHREPGPTRTAAEHRQLHPELGDEYFAENGDEWVYGEDFLDHVAAAGLHARIDRLFEDRDVSYLHEHGLKPTTECLLAFKHPDAMRRFPPAGANGN